VEAGREWVEAGGSCSVGGWKWVEAGGSGVEGWWSESVGALIFI